MMSGLSRTSSAASSAKRSLRPSAQRYSIAMVCPSIQPSSRNRSTKATVNWLCNAGVVAPRNPMVGSFPARCALAASGHAAKPPSSVTNSRLFNRSNCIRPPASQNRTAEYPFRGGQSAGTQAAQHPLPPPGCVRLPSNTLRESGHPGIHTSVESRMGAVAWAMRQRSVSHPRSSNRTCGFPASGSPTGFVVRHTEQLLTASVICAV
jgi:hypothetical protein